MSLPLADAEEICRLMKKPVERRLIAGRTGCVLPGGRGVERVAYRRPRWPLANPEGGLDIRHRLPGHLVGLAASLRSMPTAVSEDSHIPIRRSGQFESICCAMDWQQYFRRTGIVRVTTTIPPMGDEAGQLAFSLHFCPRPARDKSSQGHTRMKRLLAAIFCALAFPNIGLGWSAPGHKAIALAAMDMLPKEKNGQAHPPPRYSMPVGVAKHELINPPKVLRGEVFQG